MSAKLVLNYVLSIDACLFVTALLLMIRAGVHRVMPFFAALLAVCGLQTLLDVAVMFHRKDLHMDPRLATQIYSYSGWAVQVLGTILIFLTIYSVYDSLMRPLRGLRRAGKLLFGWVGGVGLCLTCLLVFGPHPVGTTTYATVCGQVQEGVAVLALCLLLAVSFATRPLGLTFRSRVFGTTLGLGILSTATLIEAPWDTTIGAKSPYSPIHLISAIGCMLAVSVWAAYLARPEPVRKVVTLPTTSPFFFWNRVADALGDEPGRVAVAGITPDMFAPAELAAFGSPARPRASVVEMPQAARR